MKFLNVQLHILLVLRLLPIEDEFVLRPARTQISLRKNKTKEKMDPLFMATSLFRRRRFDECVKICTEILERNAYDQVS